MKVTQIKGVAMGCHSGPSIAIIFMDHLESQALKSLPSHLSPSVFIRYIDDILLGPYPYDSNIHNSILCHFNSLNPSIKFTLESPSPNTWLPFLDLQLRVSNNFLQFCPFVKPFHSGNCLHYLSHHPPHVKSNFIKNQFLKIKKHSSSYSLALEASNLFITKLLSNGYPHSFIMSCKNNSFHKSKPKPSTNLVNLKLPFIHPSISRKIKKCIKSSNLPVRLIESSGPSITSLVTKSSSISCSTLNCKFCPLLSNNSSCLINFVVYKLSCKFCSDFYIGQTFRKISIRLKEHLSSISDVFFFCYVSSLLEMSS